MDRLAAAVRVIVQTFLVEGRRGAPAEGRLRFNPMHFGLLGQLFDEGPARPSVLATALGVPRSTLSSVAETLTSKGLLGRQADPDDARAHRLVLTEEGEETVRAMRRQDARNAAAMLEALPVAEREALLPLIERVAEGIGGD